MARRLSGEPPGDADGAGTPPPPAARRAVCFLGGAVSREECAPGRPELSATPRAKKLTTTCAVGQWGSGGAPRPAAARRDVFSCLPYSIVATGKYLFMFCVLRGNVYVCSFDVSQLIMCVTQLF